jgi:virginiamycin B lyase
VWVSEWNSGQVSVHDPKANQWKQWKLPGKNPQTYAVFVDDQDLVWMTDFGGDLIVRFDPTTERFTTFKLPTGGAKVRQILGRHGAVWLPASGTDRLAVIATPN